MCLTILFATANKSKLKEVNSLLNSSFVLKSLTDIGFSEDIPETENTLEGNALLKARFIAEKYNCNCFADDTGLEIVALDGEPGVYSARYAGEDKNSEKNMQKVLEKLTNVSNRKAHFRTVIALILDGKKHFFEGIVKGEITQEKRGVDGFGYDPIFMPDGYNKTFAEMTLQEKNQVSHRAIALKKMTEFLNEME
jgi:XTP/dITP diphosphohydrolase